MSGFEPLISGVGDNCYTNWATTTAPLVLWLTLAYERIEKIKMKLFYQNFTDRFSWPEHSPDLHCCCDGLRVHRHDRPGFKSNLLPVAIHSRRTDLQPSRLTINWGSLVLPDVGIKVAQVLPKVAQKYPQQNLFRKVLQNSPKIWANFVRKIVAEIVQK